MKNCSDPRVLSGAVIFALVWLIAAFVKNVIDLDKAQLVGYGSMMSPRHGSDSPSR